MSTVPGADAGAGVIGPEDLDGLVGFFEANGYATPRGTLAEDGLATTEAELVEVQPRLADGALDARHATDILDAPDAVVDGRPFAHYDVFATRASALADDLWSTCGFWSGDELPTALAELPMSVHSPP